ncbi:MAG: hypothetical protein WDZ29_00630 [Balneolaceae bacterium]
MAWFLCLVPAFLFPSKLAAQSEDRKQEIITIQVSASVLQSLEVVTLQGMDFSELQADQRELNIDPVLSPRAGKMVAQGSPGSSFQVTWLRNREMVNIERTGLLGIRFDVAGNYLDEQDTAEVLEPDSREYQFNEEGQFYLWIGGLVNLEDATTGAYEGEFTLEVEYN